MTTPQTPHLRRSTDRSPLRVGLLLVSLLLAYFALSQQSHAVVPAPDGGYPGGQHRRGKFSPPEPYHRHIQYCPWFVFAQEQHNGNFNTATGAGALLSNTADQNTATGAGALLEQHPSASETRPTETSRFLAIQQASKTRPTVVRRSLTISGGQTPPTVLLHSLQHNRPRQRGPRSGCAR